MKKILGLILLIAVMIIAACSPQDSSGQNSADDSSGGSGDKEVKVMKLAVATAEGRSLTEGLEKFGEIVEEETGGSVKVEVYPGAQLGGDVDVFNGLKAGTIQAGTMVTGPIATFAERFGVFDLPFVFKDEATAHTVLDGPIGMELLGDLESHGIVGVNYFENGFRYLTNNKKAVKTVEDVKGLRVRTLQNDMHIDLWKELGAIPTPMPFTELFTALEQDVVDGQENPAGNVKADKFYEVQNHLTTTGHVYGASPLMFSKKFWDTLSGEEQEAIKKAADEARDYQRELNAEETTEALEYLANDGEMTITELTPEEKEKFVEKLQPIYEKYSSKLGEDLVNRVVEAGK